jgi:hypothetical protein
MFGARLVRTAFVFVTFYAATAFGRIGETADQFSQRYGAPTDTSASQAVAKTVPLLEGAIYHVYQYQGWQIRTAFLPPEGPAVRMEYSKTPKAGGSMMIQDYELQAIMTANTPPGTSWKRTAYSNPDSPSKGFLSKSLEAYFGQAMGQQMYQRSDGAMLWVFRPATVRLELPLARQFEEQVKAQKEEKGRASVPKF